MATTGRFVWYDLMTTDPAAAKAFYTPLTGWGTQDWNQGHMPYTMWTVGERHIGGVMGHDQKMGAPNYWLPYISCEAVDATVARAVAMGATVLVPAMDIPNIGRFCVVKDPQGAVFAAWRSANPSDDQAKGPGSFSWHELMVADGAAGFAFYSELFGWVKTDAMDMGPMGTYQMYGQGCDTYGGMMNTPPGGHPSWLCYISVPSINAVTEQIKASGGTIINGPMEVPGGSWIVACLDPQGAAIAFHAEKA